MIVRILFISSYFDSTSWCINVNMISEPCFRFYSLSALQIVSFNWYHSCRSIFLTWHHTLCFVLSIDCLISDQLLSQILIDIGLIIISISDWFFSSSSRCPRGSLALCSGMASCCLREVHSSFPLWPWPPPKGTASASWLKKTCYVAAVLLATMWGLIVGPLIGPPYFSGQIGPFWHAD